MSTGNIRNTGDAARALEATLLRQLLESSGAFKGANVTGGQVQASMFVEALADAVSQSGGLGLARLLEGSLEPGGPKEDAQPDAGPSASTLTSGFGRRIHPIDGTPSFHTGVDMAGDEGAAIRAAADGVVLRAGPRGGYGQAVEIDHGAGRSTLYAHASALDVKPGDRVAQGQTIGQVGQSGRATGPHLHFEVRQDGKPIDPTSALKAYGKRVDNPSGKKPPQGG